MTTVANGKVTIPVEIGDYLTINAKLDGQGPFTFLFDTGGHAILTPEAAATLGLHPAGAGSSGGAGEGRLSEQYARAARMDIGGVSFWDRNFFVIPLQYNTVARGERPPLAGILGLEMLERLAVRLDYRNRTMTFWPRDTYRHEGPGLAVPITFTDDIPLLRAQMGGNGAPTPRRRGGRLSICGQRLHCREIPILELALPQSFGSYDRRELPIPASARNAIVSPGGTRGSASSTVLTSRLPSLIVDEHVN
jgi:Aspartyl protease